MNSTMPTVFSSAADSEIFNITNKPIESTANEILTILTDTFGHDEWRKLGER